MKDQSIEYELLNTLKNYKRSSQEIACLRSKLSTHNINWTIRVKYKTNNYKYFLEHDLYKAFKMKMIENINDEEFSFSIIEYPSPVFKYFQYIKMNEECDRKKYINDIISNTFNFCKEKYEIPEIQGFEDANVYISNDSNTCLIVYSYLFVNNNIKNTIDFAMNINKVKYSDYIIVPYTNGENNLSFQGWFNYMHDEKEFDIKHYFENSFIRLRFGIYAIDGYNGMNDFEYLKYPYHDDKITLLYKTCKENYKGNDDILKYINHFLPYNNNYEFYRFYDGSKNIIMKALLVKKGLRYTKNMKFQTTFQPFNDPKHIRIEIDKNGILNITSPQRINNLGKIDSSFLVEHSINRFQKELKKKIKTSDNIKKTFKYIEKLIKK